MFVFTSCFFIFYVYLVYMMGGVFDWHEHEQAIVIYCAPAAPVSMLLCSRTAQQ